MTLELRDLKGDAIAAHVDALAALRIEVFRDWPYLYDGSMAYEKTYLTPMMTDPAALVVGVFDGARLVGASTATRLLAHKGDFADAFAATDMSLGDVYYLAESVLLPAYRGRGLGHAFFERREAEARRQGHDFAVFCAVERAANHPARPEHYRPLDAFWHKRGYAPLPGVVAQFRWRDVGEEAETAKSLQFWGRRI